MVLCARAEDINRSLAAISIKNFSRSARYQLGIPSNLYGLSHRPITPSSSLKIKKNFATDACLIIVVPQFVQSNP